MKDRRLGDGGRPLCARCGGQEPPDHPWPPELEYRQPIPPSPPPMMCPACGSARVAPVGDLLAIGRLIEVRHRCMTCGTLFVVFRKGIS